MKFITLIALAIKPCRTLLSALAESRLVALIRKDKDIEVECGQRTKICTDADVTFCAALITAMI